MKKLLLLFIGLSLTTSLYAQEVISSFQEENMPVMNEVLRSIKSGMTDADEVTIEKTSGTFSIKLVPLANGGFGVALTDPGADRIFFWDDGAGASAFLTVGSGLTLTGTSLTADSQAFSDVIYRYDGQTIGTHEAINASLTPDAPTNLYRFLQSKSGSYSNVDTFKATKIKGVNTWNVEADIWDRGQTASIKVIANVGGAGTGSEVSGTATGTAGQQTPEAVSFTINVSGLTDGELYDCSVQIKTSTNENAYADNIIIYGT